MTSSAFDSGGAWHWQLTACCNSPAADDSFTIGRRQWMCIKHTHIDTPLWALRTLPPNTNVRVMMTTSHKIVRVTLNTPETRWVLMRDFIQLFRGKLIQIPYYTLLMNKDNNCYLLPSLLNSRGLNEKSCVSSDLR